MDNLQNIHQRQTFRRYVKEQMEKSLITGVPVIVGCKSNSRRAVKSIMFILCTVGFLYQAYTFLDSFLKYETTQNFRLEYPTQFMAPAVTFCNKNRINRERFCSAFPGECFWYKKHDEFCRDKPKFCKGQAPVMGVPHKTSNMYHNLSNEFLDAYGPQSPWKIIPIYNNGNCRSKRNGLIENCNYNDSIIIQAPSGGLPYKCFSIYSLIDKPDKEPRKISIFDDYYFLLRTHPELLMDDKDNVQFYMHVHDPRQLANPISEGIALNSGNKYTISFTMQQIQNLPPPYNTYCIDYVKKWKENGGRGPLTKKDCIELCKIERMMEQHNCVGKSIMYPHRFPICSEIITISQKTVEDCSSGCRPACDFSLYRTALEHAEEYTSDDVLTVTLKFGQMSVQKIYMDPKFQNIELFSYIGGFMGLWLGFCLVTFVDFLETVTDVVIFAVMKCKEIHRK